MSTDFHFIDVEEPAPVLLSSPHSGTEIPDVIKGTMVPEVAERREDTDWYLEQLYSFATELNMPLLHARWHRYVADLNRSTEGGSLYKDGRKETGIVSDVTFSGQNIYQAEAPSDSQVADRVAQYYQPYHDQLRTQINRLRQKHSQILLFECHSIVSREERIQPQPFPPFILGDDSGRACSSVISRTALDYFAEHGLECSHNHPFKGGFITRNYGDPENGIHALQLEMCKNNYMNESTQEIDEQRFNETQTHLRGLLECLQEVIKEV